MYTVFGTTGALYYHLLMKDVRLQHIIIIVHASVKNVVEVSTTVLDCNMQTYYYSWRTLHN